MTSVTGLSPLSVYIPEGRIKKAQKNQGIDFKMLSSCFTMTAKLSDRTLIGAHFAHFGADAEIDGDKTGKSPIDLVKAFKLALGSAKQNKVKVVELQLIGNLDLWAPSYLGISTSGKSLALSSEQKKIFKYLNVLLKKTKVVDTSTHDYVYLSFLPRGIPQIKYSSKEGKK